MTKRDYYEVLGVDKNATHKEIKKAYKKLAMQYHPDRTKGNTQLEEKFKEAQAAYEILSDEDKRQEYDDFGFQGNQFRSHGHGFNQSDMGGFQNGQGDFNDFFANMFRDQHRPRAEKGADLRYRINLSLREAINGCQKEVKFPNTDKALKVTIPQGIDEGQSVRITGKGEEGVFGGPKGDLLIQISINQDPDFQRNGADLHCFVKMSFPTAALGGTLKAPTLDGYINLKIPKGTQTGKKFRIKGKGVKPMKSHLVGDLIYEVVVETPETLTAQQEELIRQLAETFQ
ncbi:DnaJ C-terminal domain-containing protein [Psychromonas sp. MME2]|uniref:DnaJ C-terminal domain-containing protein n=1 Tax=unclassified Psychromonas TaxID=2614957 RepID=UPI00339D0BC5